MHGINWQKFTFISLYMAHIPGARNAKPTHVSVPPPPQKKGKKKNEHVEVLIRRPRCTHAIYGVGHAC